jgi:hypothetical protein
MVWLGWGKGEPATPTSQEKAAMTLEDGIVASTVLIVICVILIILLILPGVFLP